MTKRLGLVLVSAALGLCAFGPSAASAACPAHDELPFGVTPGCFDGLVAADETGDVAATQAGAHPYSVTTQIAFNTDPDPVEGPLWPAEPVRDVLVDAPPGLIGNPSIVPECPLVLLVGEVEHNFKPECPPAAQIGVASIGHSGGGVFPADLGPLLPGLSLDQPVYSMVPPPGVPARFGFHIYRTVITLDAVLRSDGDYGLSVGTFDTNEALPLLGTDVTLWGMPASPSHDPQRACPGGESPSAGGPTCPAGLPETQAFLRMPTSCAGPQQTVLHTDSWFNPAAFNPDGSPDLSDPNWKQASFISHKAEAEGGAPVGGTGCDQVPFEPAIAVKPTTTQADSPTGLEVDLTLPQDQLTDPDAIATSDLKKAVVTLPEGMSVNASSVNGLGACALAQIDLDGRNTEPNCPDDSKIGTVQIQTPLFDDPFQGTVYLAAQKDNPFGSLLALYIVAEGHGIVLKLAGKVTPTDSGRLITSFDNQPQAPFSKLHLVLRGGPQAPLINPRSCGTHTAAATLSPWSGNPPVSLTSSFELTQGPGGQPCPNGGFDPKFTAGSESPIAAAHSPFVLRLQREDGSRELTGLSVALPRGLTGKLAGIPYCPEGALAGVSDAEGTAAAQIASPSCPAASQVGRVTVGAGAGSNPFYVDTGRAYLAGPYKGAPLSMAIVTPAKAGPFDLGSVLVRTALQVDPETAQITAVSDPLPRFLHGIALDLRDVRVDIDRSGFTLNPTNCEPMTVDAAIAGTDGASAQRSSSFQVANCAALAFKPSLSFALKGGTRRAGHPAFSATLRAKPGEANIAKASVTLPKSEILDQGHIKTVCTRVQFAADACPKGSIYGYAKARTPLLDQPLSGPVYLRSNGGDRELPDLVASLDGQIHIDLVGFIDSVKGRIRNRFELVPDAPVSSFTLTMKGGKKGLLQNSTDICAKPHRATVKLDGQSGKIHDTSPALRAQCGKKRRGKGGH
jgi:hypothetical protein